MGEEDKTGIEKGNGSPIISSDKKELIILEAVTLVLD